MNDERKVIVKGKSGALAGPLWLGGWLFTIGYLGLGFWKAVLALIVWPYFLGVAMKVKLL